MFSSCSFCSSSSSSFSSTFLISLISKFVFMIVSSRLKPRFFNKAFICASSKPAMRFNFPFLPRNELCSLAISLATSSSFWHPLYFTPSSPFSLSSSSFVVITLLPEVISRMFRSNSSSLSDDDDDDDVFPFPFLSSSSFPPLPPPLTTASANFSAADLKCPSHHFSSQLYLSFFSFPTPSLSFFASTEMASFKPFDGFTPNASPFFHPIFSSIRFPNPEYAFLPGFWSYVGIFILKL